VSTPPRPAYGDARACAPSRNPWSATPVRLRVAASRDALGTALAQGADRSRLPKLAMRAAQLSAPTRVAPLPGRFDASSPRQQDRGPARQHPAMISRPADPRPPRLRARTRRPLNGGIAGDSNDPRRTRSLANAGFRERAPRPRHTIFGAKRLTSQGPRPSLMGGTASQPADRGVASGNHSTAVRPLTQHCRSSLIAWFRAASEYGTGVWSRCVRCAEFARFLQQRTH